MGLFSKKKRISTATQTMSLMEDTPDVIRQSLTTSLLGNTDIVVDLQNNMLNLFKDNVKRYYRYGRDYFTNGLPEGFMGGLAVDKQHLQTALEEVTPPDSLADESIFINLAVLDQAYYPEFMAKEYLRNNSNWNPSTNTLGIGNPFVPLEVIHYLEDRTELTPDGTHLVLTFCNMSNPVDGALPPPRYTIVEVAPKYASDTNQYFYYARYSLLDADDVPIGFEYYWTYLEGSGVYPSLDTADDLVITSQYMPIVPLRVNYTSYTDPALAGTPLYDTSKRLLNKIKVKMSEMHEGINGNPDVDQIAHAYVVLGIDVKQDTPDINEYLFSFFDSLILSSKYSKDDFTAWESLAAYSEYVPPPTNIMSISDDTYKSDLNYYYVDKVNIIGSFGAVGTYRKFIDADHEMVEVPDQYDYEDPANTVIIDYQATDTTYQRLTIAGISQTIGMYQAQDHIISLKSGENEVILVPLNHDLISNMRPLVANTLAYHSLKVVVHSYQVSYVKWYQTGLFQFVVIIIAIIITIYTGAGAALITQLSAAAAAGVVALAIFVSQMVIGSILVSAAFKFVAKKVGAEFAIVLAMVAMAYGMLGSDSAFSLPYADTMLAMSGPMSAASNEVLMESVQQVTNEYTAFMDEYKVKQEELTKLWEELQPPNRLDPLGIFTAVDMPLFENPSQYIERKTTSNIADFVGYNAIESFFKNSLNLQLV